jgi:hypothetical protein
LIPVEFLGRLKVCPRQTVRFSANNLVTHTEMYSKNIRSHGPLSTLAIALTAAFLGRVESAEAQLSKGDLILLNRGVELQAMVEWDDYFHLNTYDSLNYSSINWFSTLNPLLMGPPPGVGWSRWVSDPTQMPPQIQQGTPEGPYMETGQSRTIAYFSPGDG